MDFRQLEAFVSTVDHQSFSAAAEALFLSQPTVSAQVRALEQELHTQLIQRTTRRFELTPDGQRLYGYAVSLLQLQRKAVRELDGQLRRELLIGVSSIPGRAFLPELLRRYRALCPDVQVRVALSGSLDVIQKVEFHVLDVGLVGAAVGTRCLFFPFAKDEVVLAAPKTPRYEALWQAGAPAAALLREPFLLRTGGSGTERFFLRVLEQIPVYPEDLNVVCRINDAHVLLSCIAQGLGVSIVSRRMAECALYRDRLLVFPLEGQAVRSLYAVCRKNAVLSQPAEQFLRLCQRCAQEEDFGLS